MTWTTAAAWRLTRVRDERLQVGAGPLVLQQLLWGHVREEDLQDGLSLLAVFGVGVPHDAVPQQSLCVGGWTPVERAGMSAGGMLDGGPGDASVSSPAPNSQPGPGFGTFLIRAQLQQRLLQRRSVVPGLSDRCAERHVKPRVAASSWRFRACGSVPLMTVSTV